MSNKDTLFRPLKVRNTTFKNRIAMAPMTRSFSPNGIPGDNVRDYYERRAAADVGLIITEGTVISHGGASSDANIPLFHTEPALNAWGKVVDAVHKAGGMIAPQVWSQGMARKPGTGHYPDAPTDSPSGLTFKGAQVAPEPTQAEVEDMINSYIDGAADAARLGFDAIEFHGAHGYLIDQFFCDITNKREDKYGGDLVGRATFAAEIIKGTREKVGETPIILRWSQWKLFDYAARMAHTPQELEAFVKVFADAGVDMLHCSQRRYWVAEFPEVDGENGLNLAGWCKKLTGLPTISVGSVGLSSDFGGAFANEGSKYRPLDDLYERMEKDEFDMIAVGRALLQDPEWAKKVKEDRLDELQDYDGEAIKTLF